MPDQNNNQPTSNPFEIVSPSKPKKSGSKGVIVAVLVTLFLGLGTFLGVLLVNQNQNFEEKASGNDPLPTSTVRPTATPTRSASPTSRATSTSTATSSSTATSTSTSKSTATATAKSTQPPIPETGTGWPTYFGIGLGIITIVGSLFLAL